MSDVRLSKSLSTIQELIVIAGRGVTRFEALDPTTPRGTHHLERGITVWKALPLRFQGGASVRQKGLRERGGTFERCRVVVGPDTLEVRLAVDCARRQYAAAAGLAQSASLSPQRWH
jgi:hypothetical protein